MKRAIVLLLAVLVGSLLSEKVVLSNGEWVPYQSKTLKHYGLASRIVAEAFKNEGIDVEYKFYGDSWKRAYKDAKDGNVDGSLVWSKAPEREKDMYYSTEAVINDKRDMFFYRKGVSIKSNKLSDLKHLKFGGVLGYNYGDEFTKLEKSGVIKVERTGNDKNNLKKLAKGRVDIVIIGELNGMELINKTLSKADAKKIEMYKKPFRAKPYYLILSKKKGNSKELIKKFDKGLRKLKKDGKYNKYIKESRAGKYKK